MLRSQVFCKSASIMGISAGIAGILGIVLEHLPGIDAVTSAIVFYFLAIVFLFVWLLLMARRFYSIRKTRNTGTLAE